MSLSEFTILELLRLQRVSIDDLEMIKILFQQIDHFSCGNIDKSMLAKAKLIHGYGSFSKSDSGTPNSTNNLMMFGNELPHLEIALSDIDLEQNLSPSSEDNLLKGKANQSSSPFSDFNHSAMNSQVVSPGLRRMTYDQYAESIMKPVISFQDYQVKKSGENIETFSSPIREFLLSFHPNNEDE
jgi:hypothetical protein